MQKLVYILLLLCFGIIGCKEQTKDIQQKNSMDTVEKIEGLTQLSEQWTQDSSFFWTRTGKDSTWKELQAIDTSTVANYTITEKYQLKLQNNLILKKLIDIDPKLNTKVSETDIYIRKINPNIESSVRITYHYNKAAYDVAFLDSAGTNEKMEANRIKADSILKTANKEGLYLCETAYNAILWEDIPFLSIPRKIEKDSALSIIKQWTKDKL